MAVDNGRGWGRGQAESGARVPHGPGQRWRGSASGGAGPIDTSGQSKNVFGGTETTECAEGLDWVGGREKSRKTPNFPTGAAAWVVAPVDLEQGGKFYGNVYTSRLGYIHIAMSVEHSRGQAVDR